MKVVVYTHPEFERHLLHPRYPCNPCATLVETATNDEMQDHLS